MQNPFDFFLEPDAEHWPFRYEPALAKELAPYREAGAAGPLLNEFLSGLPRERVRTIDFLVDLNRGVQHAVEYVIRMEPGVQDPEMTLGLAKGSCRDSAWLLVLALRHLGFAARFASGYLIQLVADEKPLEGPAGAARDFTDLHAWAEVFLPGAGWIGLDATSGLLAGEGHIPLACTPDPSIAAPISGSLDECRVEFTHEMSVERIHEDARVTRPYSEAQWEEILRLGDAVDARLTAGDVRLTQGGEPTFVGIDAPDAPEWNTAALGRRETRARRGPAAPAARALRAVRPAALRPGQVVPGRAAAALGLRLLLAQGRRADLAGRLALRGFRARRTASARPRRRASSSRSPSGSAWTRASRCRPTRTPGTTCGASGACP